MIFLSQLVRERFEYNPSTGDLYRKYKSSRRKQQRTVRVGYLNITIAGRKDFRVTVKGKSYLSHRIIWLLQTGEWPKIIDHINGDPRDNRWNAIAKRGVSMKVRRKKIDVIFSNLVRERANYFCEACCENKRNSPQTLDCAHIFSRRNVSLRWHPQGAVALCRSCHIFYTEHCFDWRDWCIEHFGQDLVAELRLVSNQPVKWTKAVREDIYQHYKLEFAKMNEKRLETELVIDFKPHEVMHKFSVGDSP